MGFWGTLGKIGSAVGAGIAAPLTGGASLTALPTILGGAAAGLGAAAQGAASNRGEKLGAQFDLERLLMERDQDYLHRQLLREQEGRTGGQDAWRRLMAAQRTITPGPKPQLSRYSVAPRHATGPELQGADAMTQEVLARLMGGNPIPEQTMRPNSVDPRLMNPSAWERIAGIASPALGVLSRLPQPIQGRNPLQAANYLQQAPRL